MTNQIIADQKLKRALALYEEKRIAILEEKIDYEIDFSENFEKRMQKLFRFQRKPYYKFINTAGKRVAMIILSVITALSVATLSVEALRKPFIEIVISIYEQFTGVSYKNEDSPQRFPLEIEEVFLPMQLPDGYTLMESNNYGVAIKTIFSNGTNDLYFEQYTITATQITIDTEGVEIETLTINDHIVLFFNNKGINTIMWTDGSYGYTAFGSLDKNALIELVNTTKN